MQTKEEYARMISPENKSSTQMGVVFGNQNGDKVDYFYFQDFSIRYELLINGRSTLIDKKLVDIIKEKDNKIRVIEKNNNDLLDVIALLKEKIEEIERKLNKYGL